MTDVQHQQTIEARIREGEIVIEPPEINGVRGFEVRMSPSRAREFGHKLIGLATQSYPQIGKGATKA